MEVILVIGIIIGGWVIFGFLADWSIKRDGGYRNKQAAEEPMSKAFIDLLKTLGFIVLIGFAGLFLTGGF